MPKGAEKEINDILLTRYACYLIGQNGDSRKEEVSFAQNDFAVQTRRAELVEKRLLEYESVKAREKLSQTEKQLSGILYERGVDGQGFALIRSKGDQALFRLSTVLLKKKEIAGLKPHLAKHINFPKDNEYTNGRERTNSRAKPASKL